MKLFYKIILAVYLAALLWLVLFKFSLDLASASSYQTGLNLMPFAGASQSEPSEMISNFVIFIPFGLLLSVIFKPALFGRKFASIVAFSVAAEAVQLVFAIGTADITDIITNSSGGLLGLLLYSFSNRYINGQKLDRYIAAAGAILLLSLLGVLFSGQVRFQSAPGAKAKLSPAATVKDLQLIWPATGVAAIGTIEEGVLARSTNDEKLRPTASMAKVITALALMERQPLMLGQSGESYTMTSEDVANYRAEVSRKGSAIPVHAGMVLTQYEAMQVMLLASANNIADTLVERVFGSEKAYVSYAQDMLRRKGFNRTVVDDASGYSPSTVSTPSELVALGIEALSNPVIAEIVAQQEAWIPGVGVIQNTNQLLGTDGVVGLKTGTTDKAGSCLLFAASYIAKDGEKVVIVGVVMDSANAASLFSDSRELLASTRQGLGLSEPQTESSDVAPQPVQRGRVLRQ